MMQKTVYICDRCGYENDAERLRDEVERLKAERDALKLSLGTERCYSQGIKHNLEKYEESEHRLANEVMQLRERLDHYEQGRCCVEEPPTECRLALVRPMDGTSRFELMRWMTETKRWVWNGKPRLDLAGWRWYPLPGGRDD